MPLNDIFDTELILKNKKKSIQNIDSYCFLFDKVLDNLNSRFDDISLKFNNILDLSFHKDISKPNSYDILENKEILSFNNNKFDCVFSNLNLQMVNDLPGVLTQINNIIKPNGVFLASVFGAGTLFDLKKTLMVAEMELYDGVSPRVYPFIDIKDMGALLQRAGFTLPVVDSDIITVEYDNIFKLMDDLKGMGLSNSLVKRKKTLTHQNLFKKANELYPRVNGKIEAKFEILYMIGWKYDKDQQKPAKRGSGQVGMEVLE